MIIDKDQDSVDKKNLKKMEDISKLLVSNAIREREGNRNDCSIIKLENKIQKKKLLPDFSNFYKFGQLKVTNSELSDQILFNLKFQQVFNLNRFFNR